MTGRDLSRLLRRGTAEATTTIDTLRERLQANMTALAATWDESVWFRVRKELATLPFVVRAGASVAFVAFALQFLWRAPESDSQPRPSAAMEAESLPNGSFTPGATAAVSLEELSTGRPAKHAIPPTIRQAVLRGYQMEQVSATEYELDYLITPELGGIGDPRNLWPERYASGVWNARVKDDLERLLPRLVCQGTLDLGTAQRDIADNWIAAYKKYFKTDHPVAQRAGQGTSSIGRGQCADAGPETESSKRRRGRREDYSTEEEVKWCPSRSPSRAC
ncbi:MAG: hypothetical protein ACRD2I_16245 [Vicinamibacterales bacterium]